MNIPYSSIDSFLFYLELPMTTPNKPTIIGNLLSKTYGQLPVPFQFPDSEEKMYIGSEVNEIS